MSATSDAVTNTRLSSSQTLKSPLAKEQGTLHACAPQTPLLR